MFYTKAGNKLLFLEVENNCKEKVKMNISIQFKLDRLQMPYKLFSNNKKIYNIYNTDYVILQSRDDKRYE